MKFLPITSIVLVFVSQACLLYAQQRTLLPDLLLDAIIHQVSGERAWWHVHSLARYHRIQPYNGYHQAALYVEEQAKKYRLQDVKIEKFVADSKIMNFTFRLKQGNWVIY